MKTYFSSPSFPPIFQKEKKPKNHILTPLAWSFVFCLVAFIFLYQYGYWFENFIPSQHLQNVKRILVGIITVEFALYLYDRRWFEK